MAAGIWFWVIFVLCTIFYLWSGWPTDGHFLRLGSNLVVFILLGLLGWKVFGPPIQG